MGCCFSQAGDRYASVGEQAARRIEKDGDFKAAAEGLVKMVLDVYAKESDGCRLDAAVMKGKEKQLSALYYDVIESRLQPLWPRGAWLVLWLHLFWHVRRSLGSCRVFLGFSSSPPPSIFQHFRLHTHAHMRGGSIIERAPSNMLRRLGVPTARHRNATTHPLTSSAGFSFPDFSQELNFRTNFCYGGKSL